jgi:hypothetical protein
LQRGRKRYQIKENDLCSDGGVILNKQEIDCAEKEMVSDKGNLAYAEKNEVILDKSKLVHAGRKEMLLNKLNMDVQVKGNDTY